jgi:enoyl-CoA hydratase
MNPSFLLLILESERGHVLANPSDRGAWLQRSDERGVVTLECSRPASSEIEIARLTVELAAACEAIEQSEARPVAVVLSTPSGCPFFVAPPASAADCDAAAATWGRATDPIASLGAPTVAHLAGDAIGPGWELALACDLRVVSAASRVGSPEITWGRIPACGGTQRLTRLVGRGAALQLLLLGEVLPAAEAGRRGLIHRWDESVARQALAEVLGALRRAAPDALAYTKEAARAAGDLTSTAGHRLEADLAALLLTTSDRAEGVAAALERRAPWFQGQ